MKVSLVFNTVCLSSALGICLLGCENENEEAIDGTMNAGTTSENERAFSEEVIRLKSDLRNDPDRINALVKELRDDYRLAIPKEIPPSTLPAPYVKERLTAMDPLPATTAIPSAEETPRALAYKAHINRKDVTYSIRRPFIRNFSVASGAAISASATGIKGADPFAVLYRCLSGCHYSETGQLSVLAVNDDYNGLNPYVTWTNNTGSTVEVTTLVFPYSQNSAGTVNIDVNVGGTLYDYDNQPLVGVTMYYNSGYKYGCDDPWTNDPCPNHQDDEFQTGDEQIFATIDWACATPNTNDTWIWVFNFETMEGLTNDDDGYGSLGSKIYEESILPENTFYPNHMVLLGGYSDRGTARFLQADPFRCFD